MSRPYDAIGGELGIAGEEVIVRLQRMLDIGVIRRIGAVPNHYAIGYTANGMSVWDVADERIDELGARVGALAFVTHCYRRPRRLPDWPYNLFAMVHSQTREEVAARVGGDRGAARRCLPGARHSLQHGNPEEDRPAHRRVRLTWNARMGRWRYRAQRAR